MLLKIQQMSKVYEDKQKEAIERIRNQGRAISAAGRRSGGTGSVKDANDFLAKQLYNETKNRELAYKEAELEHRKSMLGLDEDELDFKYWLEANKGEFNRDKLEQDARKHSDTLGLKYDELSSREKIQAMRDAAARLRLSRSGSSSSRSSGSAASDKGYKLYNTNREVVASLNTEGEVEQVFKLLINDPTLRNNIDLLDHRFKTPSVAVMKALVSKYWEKVPAIQEYLQLKQQGQQPAQQSTPATGPQAPKEDWNKYKR
jgi:hypothetical protein